MIYVRAIEAHEWQTYRDARLQALRDTPDAFGSTLASEAMRTDEAWSARIAAATTGGKDKVFIALDGELPCGLVWCKLSVAEPARADLYQMWVAPASRGKGAGQALLQAALTWARSAGMQRLVLGVTVADSPAMRLYRRHGFRPVGPVEPLREGSHLMEQAMALELGPA